MSNQKYRSYKFIYTNNLGQNVIKRQRVYLDNNGNEIVPLTALFLARVVNFSEKVTGTSQGLRHLEACIAGHKVKINLPYNSSDPSFLVAHIIEVLALNEITCINYRGESLIADDSSSSI